MVLAKQGPRAHSRKAVIFDPKHTFAKRLGQGKKRMKDDRRMAQGWTGLDWVGLQQAGVAAGGVGPRSATWATGIGGGAGGEVGCWGGFVAAPGDGAAGFGWLDSP